MTLPGFTDNFDRADGAIGNGWIEHHYPGGSAGPQLAGNKVVYSTATDWELFHVCTLLPLASVSIDLAAATNSSGGYAHVFAGTSAGAGYDQNIGISASQGQAGDWKIWSWDGVGATVLAAATGTHSAGTMELRKDGNVYSGYMNGALQVSWTDAGGTAQWGDVAGFISGADATNSFDNFATQYVPPPASTYLDSRVSFKRRPR